MATTAGTTPAGIAAAATTGTDSQVAAIPRDLPFPVGLRLAGRRVVVVGSDDASARRVELLAGTGADVVRVAPPPSPEDLAGAFLVMLCVADEDLARALDARARRGEFLLACLDSDRGAFEMPAVVRRGSLQIAVSTAGGAPGLAALLRRELERLFPDEVAGFVERLASLRASLPKAERREAMLRAVEGVHIEGKLKLPR